MGIKQDPETGLYSVSYGKRHPITRVPISLRRVQIKSKAEAKRIYDELVISVEDRLRRSEVFTWKELVETFMTDCEHRGLRRSTMFTYEKCLSAHTMPAWQDRLIDTITSAEVSDLVQSRLGSRAVGHQKYFYRVVRSIFQYAVDRGDLQRNPVPVRKFKSPDKLKGVLTEPQCRLLLEKARDSDVEWYPHWTMALNTGMRNGELFALTWDKVNLEALTIKIDCSWSSKDGFKSTKSGDDRIVEISPGLLPLLQELKAKSFEVPYVLPRLVRWERGQQAHDLRTFLIALGLQPMRFHDLRASWATILLGRGVAPIKIMKMGGWKDLETMMIYARKAGVDVRGALSDLKIHDHAVSSANVVAFRSPY